MRAARASIVAPLGLRRLNCVAMSLISVTEMPHLLLSSGVGGRKERCCCRSHVDAVRHAARLAEKSLRCRVQRPRPR